MKDNFWKIKSVYIVIVSLFTFNVLLTICKVMEYGFFFVDFHARWKESAYLCLGISPYNVNETNINSSIGPIDSGMITVPWAWVLGMFMNPGFLPYDIAKIVGILVYGFIYLITCFVIFKYWKRTFGTCFISKNSMHFAILSSLLIGCQIYWWWALVCGNQGAVVACIIVICLCICDKFPILCGMLMGVSMIKPQLAAIFFLTFFLEKRYKIIFTAALVDILALGGVALVTDSSIIILLMQTFRAGSSLEEVYFGLFDLLKFYSIPTYMILLTDVLAGVIFVVVYFMGINNKRDKSIVFVRYAGTAIASMFWFYKQPHDNVILVIPCIAFLYITFTSERKQIWVTSLLSVAFLVGSFYIQGLCRLVINLMEIKFPPDFVVSIGRTLQSLCCVFCGFLLLKGYNRKEV